MPKTYSYDPTLIGTAGKDKMRFELGDTQVENGGVNAAICDEEITAILTAQTNWLRAKLAIVESIYRRFSYEITISASNQKLDLQGRAEHWKRVYDDLRRIVGSSSAPGIDTNSTTEAADGGHYFYSGMHDNPEVNSSDEI